MLIRCGFWYSTKKVIPWSFYEKAKSRVVEIHANPLRILISTTYSYIDDVNMRANRAGKLWKLIHRYRSNHITRNVCGTAKLSIHFLTFSVLAYCLINVQYPPVVVRSGIVNRVSISTTLVKITLILLWKSDKKAINSSFDHTGCYKIL